jgi:hypothetical protein
MVLFLLSASTSSSFHRAARSLRSTLLALPSRRVLAAAKRSKSIPEPDTSASAASNRPTKSAQPYTLPPPSDEQLEVIRAVAEENNVIVDSVAGSGKTTTVMHLARALPNKQMLLLTYNSRLKDETRKRVEELALPNLEVHSFHALTQKVHHCGRSIHHLHCHPHRTPSSPPPIRLPTHTRASQVYSATPCTTDWHIEEVVKADLPPRGSLRLFDVVIVDEVTPLSSPAPLSMDLAPI